MKFVQTNYGTKKEILKFPDHFVAVPVIVDDTGITPNAEGKKIVVAGSIVGGGVLANPTLKATVQNDADAEGVLFYDVDVTDGPRSGAMLVHAFIDLAKIPTAPSAEAIEALKGRILFLK